MFRPPLPMRLPPVADVTSAIYRGLVTHQRLIPLKHRLAYRVFMLLLDLGEVATLDRGGPWFGYNRRALFSFHDADHGAHRAGISLRDWVHEQLGRAAIDCTDGRVRILCFPRVLGYAFNPLSILFCHDRDGQLRAVLYEVNNTFGERHGYLFAVPAPCPPVLEQACAKSFYVSPFMAMKADYDFRLSPPGETFGLVIRQKIESGDQMIASWTGKRQDWSDNALKACFWRYPLLTFKIIGAIHWHGLRVYLKGAKFHRRPPLPRDRISVEDNGGSHE